jgi:segregation and condensation protein B
MSTATNAAVEQEARVESTPKKNGEGKGKASAPKSKAPKVKAPKLEQLMPVVEALLTASDRPLGSGRIAAAMAPEFPEPGVLAKAVDAAVESLNETYEKTGRAFRIAKVSNGYRMMTQPEHSEVISRLLGEKDATRLTRAAIESLAIVAYRQPITRAQIESIRGVASGDILRALLERKLVAITGRAEELGRPMLYGTTKHFLEVFGLANLKDLPKVQELFESGAATSVAEQE